jgi:hypothetical protein
MCVCIVTLWWCVYVLWVRVGVTYAQERKKRQGDATTVAIVRVEQLAPLPYDEIERVCMCARASVRARLIRLMCV